MHLQSHIINTLPVFHLDDSMTEVIEFFQHTTFSHVAIVEDRRFAGVLSETDLDTFEQVKKVEDYRYELESFFARKDTSWLDALELFARNEANLIPVLDENDSVLGYFDLNDVVAEFIDTPFFIEPGVIIVVAKGIKDYSFSEIAQIVESNNARLLGAIITETRDEIIQITLKITSENSNDVIQTLRRYNYNILFGNDEDQFIESLRRRSEYLDKYLNV